jgi:Mat/Ecp fimbriae major subunit
VQVLKKMAKATKPIVRKQAKCLAVACALPLALIGASTAGAATVPGQGRATIVTAGQLVKSDDLRFGLIIPTPTAGSVTIVPATGARTKLGTLTLAGTAFGPAKFTALGNPNQNTSLQLTLPANMTITRVGGGGSMTVNNWTFSGSGVSVLNAQGFYLFNLGARLNVGANQPVGNYTGTFTMTVNFL